METLTTLTEDEMTTLAERARGFFQKPDPDQLKAAMRALDPQNPQDSETLGRLKSSLKSMAEAPDDNAVYNVVKGVRADLGFPVTQPEELARWHYNYPMGL